MTREEAIKKLESLKISLPAAKDEISEIIKLIDSPWISVKDDLPCNHDDLLVKKGLMTKRVIVVEDNHIMFDRMTFGDNGWDWATSICPSHWALIPELPKE